MSHRLIISVVYDSPAADPLLRAVLRSTARVGDGGLPRAGYGPVDPARDTVSVRFLVETFREIESKGGSDQALLDHANLIAGLSPDGIRSLTRVFAMMYVIPGHPRGLHPALTEVNPDLDVSEMFDIAADHILCSVMKSKRLVPDVFDEEGWVVEEDGDMGASYYRLSGDTLEIVINTDDVSSPYPPIDVDITGVKNLVLFGDAFTDDLAYWLPDMLLRTPNLEAFAAVDVTSDNDSFNCVAEADLPMFHTLVIDVLDRDRPSDVLKPSATVAEIRSAMREKDHPFLIMVRHDVDCSDDEYEPCPGLLTIC
jgi:hypothetical protein